jgi:hypothetical protein
MTTHKKISLMFLTTLMITGLAAGTAQAQTTEVERGFRIGMSAANTSGDDPALALNVAYDIDSTRQNRSGFCGGLFMTYHLQPTLAIQPELLYSQKGFILQASDGNAEIFLNYVEIPVLLKYLIPSKGSVKPAVFAGPFVAFKAGTSASVNVDEEDNPGDAAEVEDVLQTVADDVISGTDFGLVLGGSLNINQFVVDARYTVGLANMLPDVPGWSTQTTALSVSAGMTF